MDETSLARKYYQSSLKSDPANPRVYYRLALCALRKGNRPAGVDYLRRSLDIQPDFRPAIRKLEELGREI